MIERPCPRGHGLNCNCDAAREQRLQLNADLPARKPQIVNDEPGALRVKLRDHQSISGSGNDFSVVRVVAEHAERAAFARQALAVKLRELEAACDERDRYDLIAHNLTKECRDLANECGVRDAGLDAAINGTLRRAR